jgi:hypothetical protein
LKIEEDKMLKKVDATRRKADSLLKAKEVRDSKFNQVNIIVITLVH